MNYHLIRAANLAEIGRKAEAQAQAEIAESRKLNPKLSLAFIKKLAEVQPWCCEFECPFTGNSASRVAQFSPAWPSNTAAEIAPQLSNLVIDKVPLALLAF